MRIASLLPSATEIVCALGLADMLAGVSHECDYPAEVVSDLPRLTRSAIPHSLSSAEVDAAVSARFQRGESLYLLEEELLTELEPDILITQQLCDVCAVTYDDVCRLSTRLPGQPPVLALAPQNIARIFEDICSVATAIGRPDRAEKLIGSLRSRLEQVSRQVEERRRPRVFALEWLDPPFAAGHWVPEMIAYAGGDEVIGRPGEKSVRVTWDRIIAAQPEIILLIPCGYSPEAAEREFGSLPKPQGWESIPAVQAGRIHALDANGCFSRPGPRIIEGIESLVAVFHSLSEHQNST